MNPRAAVRIAGLALLFLAVAPVHVVTKIVFRRSAWPPAFLRAAGWIAGARVKLEGAPIQRHSLLVSNHVSWLDILMLGGSANSAFVSKDQLVSHVCEWGEEVSANAIEVYVHRLRKKLEPGGVRIVTVRGLGYSLEKPEPR